MAKRKLTGGRSKKHSSRQHSNPLAGAVKSGNTYSVPAIIEIDPGRGVIYVHGTKTGITILRICGLPVPIPVDTYLEITHMVGTDWLGKSAGADRKEERRRNNAAALTGWNVGKVRITRVGGYDPDAPRTRSAEDARGDEFEPV